MISQNRQTRKTDGEIGRIGDGETEEQMGRHGDGETRREKSRWGDTEMGGPGEIEGRRQ